MHPIRTGGALAGLLAVAMLAVPPAEAEPTTAPSVDDCARVSAATYHVGNATFSSMPANLTAGSQLTVRFQLEGCEQQVTLAAYQAQAGFRLSEHGLVDVDTGVYAEGQHNLTVTVPDCLFEIDLAFGAAIEHFVGANGTYHGQDRIIASVRGGIECGAPGLQAEVCPPEIRATTRGEGSIELSWNATLNTTTQLVYRADDDNAPKLLGEVRGNTLVDNDVDAEVAYTYDLAIMTGDGKQDCASVQIGQVPSFPTAFAGAMAMIVAALGYAFLRRS